MIKGNNSLVIRDLKMVADDRGLLDQLFNDDLPFLVKRIYVVYPRKGIVRGLHGHKRESKAFWVFLGSAKFAVVPMQSTGQQMKTFTLDYRKPQLLIVPHNHYNGFVALEDNTGVLCLSSLSLEESERDDYRVDPYKFGDPWKVESR